MVQFSPIKLGCGTTNYNPSKYMHAQHDCMNKCMSVPACIMITLYCLQDIDYTMQLRQAAPGSCFEYAGKLLKV